MNIEIIGTAKFDGYIIDVKEEIRRVLKTKKGSIPMLPEYGSELYKLRDRTFDDEVRLKAISYTYDAIEKWVKRVKVKKVEVIPNDENRFNLRIEIDPA